MEIKDLKFFTSAQGRQLLAEYEGVREGDLPQLALKLQKQGIEHAPAVITLLKLRQKARGKFARSQEMYFTPLGLEQATSEAIARHIAKRFDGKGKVADLTAGNGGNAIFLAQNNRTVATDTNDMNLECARLNAQAYGVEQNMEFICGPAEENIPPDTQAFFIDPARDRPGKTKTRSILNSRPDILQLLPVIFRQTKNVCIKISPAFDYTELALLPEQPEIELISEENNVKVALLWFGDFKSCERRATVFNSKGYYSLTDRAEAEPELSLPQAYIFEPDKAISKAHLVNELATQYGLKKLSADSTLLTSEMLIPCPCRIFKLIRLVELSGLAAVLKALGISKADVIVKRQAIEPAEAYRRFKLKEGSAHCLIFTILEGKRVVFVTERAG